MIRAAAINNMAASQRRFLEKAVMFFNLSVCFELHAKLLA
jgi:hypothetical protein